MLDAKLILHAVERLFAQNEEAVLASVVEVSGSVYRRPGARLLITANGESFGGVSGGCLEGDLTRKAWWRTELGPCVLTYDSTADAETAWHLGLGCNGVVHVLLERISRKRPGPLAFVKRCLKERRTGVIATAIRADAAAGIVVGERLTLDSMGHVDTDFNEEFADQVRSEAESCLIQERRRTVAYQRRNGEVEIAFEIVYPPIRLIVFGGGFDVAPVVCAAQSLGWSTTIVSRRRTASCNIENVVIAPAATACERLQPDERTAAVVMNHNFDDDREAVEALLQSNARYIGVLGPKARTETMRDDIGDSWDWKRVHAPIGLDVGADAPEEIATAVVAEVIAVFARRGGGKLREREGPIHDVSAELIVESAP
jgi:xanthine/CO dehydrogenase XdhC/CoxF family maturation factor